MYWRLVTWMGEWCFLVWSKHLVIRLYLFGACTLLVSSFWWWAEYDVPLMPNHLRWEMRLLKPVHELTGRFIPEIKIDLFFEDIAPFWWLLVHVSFIAPGRRCSTLLLYESAPEPNWPSDFHDFGRYRTVFLEAAALLLLRTWSLSLDQEMHLNVLFGGYLFNPNMWGR